MMLLILGTSSIRLNAFFCIISTNAEMGHEFIRTLGSEILNYLDITRAKPGASHLSLLAIYIIICVHY